MKSLSGRAAILLSVILAVPAWADYSGSAVLDWPSLRFTSVAFELIPHTQHQAMNLTNWNLLNPQIPGDPFTNKAAIIAKRKTLCFITKRHLR